MLSYLVLFCLLKHVFGGIMIDKLPLSKPSVDSDGAISSINTINSAIIEHIKDLLDEVSKNCHSQKASGKTGFRDSKVFCSSEVNEKLRHCNSKCSGLSVIQYVVCKTKNLASYLGACFSGSMECYTDTSVTVGDCSSKCNCGTVNDRKEKIYGGSNVEYEVKYPWHVGLINTKKGKTAFCGGAIIGDMFVLTSAYCIQRQNINDKDFSVRIGDHIQTSKDDDIKDVTQTISVEKIYFHPQNNKDTLENDIALLKLNKSITFKSEFGIRPVCLPCTSDSDDYAGKLAITLGWGKTIKDPKEVPRTLKQAEVTISDKNCNNKATNNFNPDIQMCSFSTLTKGLPCVSDNGGSLFVNEGSTTNEHYVLVGITLQGTCDETKPAIYTRVKPAMTWIQSLNFTSTCPAKNFF